jgi:hypothetical protein
MPLQGGLVGGGLGNMRLHGAWLADDQGVGPVSDELQRVQLEVRLTGQLRIEAPVEVGERGLLNESRASFALQNRARLHWHSFPVSGIHPVLLHNAPFDTGSTHRHGATATDVKHR